MENIDPQYCGIDRAAQISGRSPATLYRLIRSGEIKTLLLPRPGRKPQTRLFVPDVERAALNRTPAPASNVPEVRRDHSGQIDALGAILQLTRPTPPASPTLSIATAAAEFGLPISYVLQLAQAQTIGAVRRGAWIISRRSLEAFVNNGFKVASNV